MSAATTTQHDLQQRAKRVLAGGVSSNTRLLNPHLIVERARGCRLWDADGTEYLDYLLGQGPNFLGYAPPRVVEKIVAAQHDGIIYAATHRREIEAAERILAVLPWADQLRFGSSSSEMIQAAMRIARNATGRRSILRFHGHYHGWFDNIQIRSDGAQALPGSLGQIADALDPTVTIEWNDAEAFAATLAEHGDTIAAVVMEPMMLNAGAIVPAEGYLQHVRDLCSRAGIVLIFDETISGFRVSLGGAAELFGVTPDLAVYGKAMAAGWPCAALVGRHELFADVATGALTHAGTFNGNTIASAAVLASLDELEDRSVYRHVETVGSALIEALTALVDHHDVPIRFQGLPMAFHARFDSGAEPITRYPQLQAIDDRRYGRFANQLITSGIWVAYRGIWYVSAAHTIDDVDETVKRFDAALSEFTQG
ncbi:aspartate aminotransferase family protein [Mycolicibacterium komossense]|uniref:Aminotransferase class III-fold pyridoxal phosphate-dependent enzyme n=1 Tax=Mycolicibacterium komossense TaxID=1779 RepID=A0ABT3C5V8_9MYCO|nr:aminotransferase class III-fold pyridoxal phosphate-dependent enzyme [Mycolicibacterium komossense]MCV7224858.1 aminotransferase class III-fold pyridoxal phosphate-dependent enzyme [Mycolicibacterium komossense]